MMSRRSIALALTIAVLSGPAWSASGSAVKMFDTDNDGTLDLAEVKKAASALFAKLDADHDGTLDARELRGRLSAKSLPPPILIATGLSRSTNTCRWSSSASTQQIPTRTERWTRRN